MEYNGFYQFFLPLDRHLFQELSNSVDWEDVAKGRQGNHLVDVGPLGVPIVRTTTKYTKAAQVFSPIHHEIVACILQQVAQKPDLQGRSLNFNNALIEIYDHQYVTMKYHSDQCLDVAADSFFAVFSCYERPDDLSEQVLRKLKVQSKTTGQEFEFVLEHNSVVLFSFETNAKYQHKIILEPVKGGKPIPTDNRWLGITFRQSKTWIRFKGGAPHFPNGEPLTMADEDQTQEFYRLRGAENKSMEFTYPSITYTINVGDTLLPSED